MLRIIIIKLFNVDNFERFFKIEKIIRKLREIARDKSFEKNWEYIGRKAFHTFRIENIVIFIRTVLRNTKVCISHLDFDTEVDFTLHIAF